MKESGQSVTEFCLTLMLLAIVALIFMALLGPHVSQALSQVNFTSSSVAAYQTNDEELTGIDLALETYVSTETHGDIKHADVYGAVITACQTPDYQLWVRPSKRVDVCFVDGLGWGFRVLKQIGGMGDKAVWSERTAYIRDEIKTFEDLVRYASDNDLILKAPGADGTWIIIN